MKRREFLILSSKIAALGGMSQLLPLPVWANPGAQARFKNLITVTFVQGWDVVLGLDPQTKDSKVSDTALFLGYGPDEIVRAQGLKFGPSAAVLKEVADRCVVVNGVSMLGNVSHEDSRRMALTGILDRKAPQASVLKAASSSKAPRVMSIGSPVEDGQIDVTVTDPSDMAKMAASQEIDTYFLENDGVFAANARMMAKYQSKVADLIKENPSLTAKLQEPGSNSGAIALALGSGYTRAAHITIGPNGNTFGLDTHSNHKRDHLNFQADCFAQVMDIVNTLKQTTVNGGKTSVFDDTLIVVTSDFSREAFLNASSVDTAGKEHNGYTNSYLLMGGSLQGGYTIGESVMQPKMLGKPTLHTARNFDFTTGKVIRKRSDAPAYMSDAHIKKQIVPGHVIATLADLLDFRALLDPTLATLPTLKLRG